MKSIILCEGSTDFVLLQYFMRKVYGWEDKKTNEQARSKYIRYIRTMFKDADSLSIGGCGGSNRILPGFDHIMEYNSLSAESESYDKVVIITDRDECETERVFIEKLEKILQERNMKAQECVNNKWVGCLYKNGHGKDCVFSLLILVIPFEETGAMETFLVNAISQNNSYDAGIIENCNTFVSNIDKEKRYLTKRRYITKAKFDVYFSVRTAAEQFMERQNILKNIEWEKYIKIQKDFEKLGDL